MARLDEAMTESLNRATDRVDGITDTVEATLGTFDNGLSEAVDKGSEALAASVKRSGEQVEEITLALTQQGQDLAKSADGLTTHSEAVKQSVARQIEEFKLLSDNLDSNIDEAAQNAERQRKGLAATSDQAGEQIKSMGEALRSRLAKSQKRAIWLPHGRNRSARSASTDP